MRIAVFTTDDFLPPCGGAEFALGEIIRRNPDIEFDVYCAKLFAGRPQKQVVGNATIIRFGFAWGIIDKLMFVLLAPFVAARNHHQKKYDAGWAMMASWGGLAAASFNRKTQVPYLLTLQEGDSLDDLQKKTRMIRPMFARIFSQAAALQPISRYLEQWGRSMGFRGTISEIVPNGVEVERFAAPISNEERHKIRTEWNLKTGDVALITASRLVKKNGVGDVIEAMKDLSAHVHFIVCGFGSLEEELKTRVKELELENRVHFLGIVSQEKLPAYLQASDLFIRASLTEGLGNAFLEAMAAGIPVIGTPVGGIPDFLEDGVTGVMCQPENPSSIVKAVNAVLSLSSEQRQMMTQHASEMVSKRFEWNGVARRMHSLFERLSKIKHV